MTTNQPKPNPLTYLLGMMAALVITIGLSMPIRLYYEYTTAATILLGLTVVGIVVPIAAYFIQEHRSVK